MTKIISLIIVQDPLDEKLQLASVVNKNVLKVKLYTIILMTIWLEMAAFCVQRLLFPGAELRLTTSHMH